MGSLHGAITVRFIVTNWSLKIHRIHICHGYVPIASVERLVATVTVTRAYSDCAIVENMDENYRSVSCSSSYRYLELLSGSSRYQRLVACILGYFLLPLNLLYSNSVLPGLRGFPHSHISVRVLPVGISVSH